MLVSITTTVADWALVSQHRIIPRCFRYEFDSRSTIDVEKMAISCTKHNDSAARSASPGRS